MEQKTLLITGFEPFQQETINPFVGGGGPAARNHRPLAAGEAAPAGGVWQGGGLGHRPGPAAVPPGHPRRGAGGRPRRRHPRAGGHQHPGRSHPRQRGQRLPRPARGARRRGRLLRHGPLCARWSRRQPPRGFPASCPIPPGAYVCNDLFYRLLHQYRGTGVLVDFIHVPFLPEQAKNGEPSMALAGHGPGSGGTYPGPGAVSPAHSTGCTCFPHRRCDIMSGEDGGRGGEGEIPA